MKQRTINEEQHLVALAKKGDNNAFKELYMINKEKIFTLTYQYTRNRQDAEDLLQEIFSKAFLSIDKYHARANARFSTWLYRIGINCSLNFVKKRKLYHSRTDNEEKIPMADMACTRENPEEALTIQEMYSQLENGLDQLSPNQRMIFALKHQQGLKSREIAEHMNCSEGSVKKQLSRAVASLTRRLSAVSASSGELR